MKDETPLAMTSQERDRLYVIRQIKEKRLKQVEGARQLGLSVSHVRHLTRRYEALGDAGLISGHRQTQGNHRIADEVVETAKGYLRQRYSDFGPTMAAEQLWERHQIQVSKETVRQWLIEMGLHQVHRHKVAKRHPSRQRRSSRGELVQIDGSPHAWLEERADPCCLIAFIDDATSEWISGLFVPAETTQAYFDAVRQHVKKDGRCIAYYSDKHQIFRDNHPVTPDSIVHPTQLQRALKQLNITLICAHSPQAKGRIERLFKTLQQRLVKALRLAEIHDIEAANTFLPQYMAKHNQRFAVRPQCEVDAHRPLTISDEQLEQILCHHHQRKLTKNLELSYHNQCYTISPPKGLGYRLRYATVTLCDNQHTGQLTIHYQDQSLDYQVKKRVNQQTPIVNDKTLNHFINRLLKRDRRTVGHKPSIHHPWRCYQSTECHK